MLDRMRHIEVHVLETETDAFSAVASGLLDDPAMVTACVDCGDDIGALETFEPYCVVLDDEDRWFICTYCAEPVTDPESTESYDYLPLEDDEDDEDDRFVVLDD